MPKAAGSEMKTIRAAPRLQPVSRAIKRFEQPAPFVPPKLDPPTASNEIAAHAVHVASSPGKTNPKQIHN